MDRGRDEWWRVVGMAGAPESAVPGCKGTACPAFAICQGRCASRRAARQNPAPTDESALREDYSGGRFLA